MGMQKMLYKIYRKVGDKLLLGRTKEIVELAKIYMEKYNICPLEAIKLAMRDIGKGEEDG